LVNRKSNSPWGSSYKEGLPSTAVNDTVEVDQNLRATVTTGVIDVATGQWKGITLSDEQFTIGASADAVANGASFLFPQLSDHEYINMTNYNDLYIAIKPSNGGTYPIEAVMGPATYMYSNLTPVDAASTLRGHTTGAEFSNLLKDTGETLTADVWNIRSIDTRLSNEKLLQFKITNSSGGESNIQFAYLRVV